MTLGKSKKLLLLGFITILLIAIPATIFLLQQQQQTQIQAEKSTNLSFDPPSTKTAPIEAAVGEQVDLDLMVDPGKNIVSILRVEIEYKPDKLELVDGKNSFALDPTVFPSFLEGPILDPSGKIAATLSVSNATEAIQIKKKFGTISFKAKAPTGSTPTEVSYTIRTQAFSIAGPPRSNDQASEDVLQGKTPAYIAITGAEPPVTEPPDGGGTPTPTEPGTGGPPNEAPICENLNVDRELTGTAPYSVTFTANGGDADGTINKATFNFGDGPVVNVTEGGDIGSASVSAQIAHTYNNPGTFVASAVLTDERGSASSGSCTLTITIQGAIGGPETFTPTPSATPTLIPSIPQDLGPGDTILGLGAVIGVLSAIGGLLFFVF